MPKKPSTKTTKKPATKKAPKELKKLGGQYASPKTDGKEFTEAEIESARISDSSLRKDNADNQSFAASAKKHETKSDRKPTEEQQLILDEVQLRRRALVVEAGAGTGKTTTLRMVADSLAGLGQYTAFNSSLVAESKEKFRGTRVSCNTTHALAFRAVGKTYAHRLNGNRVKADVLAQLMGVEDLTVTVGENPKRLSAGYLAVQVTGAIRKFCQSDDREIGEKHFKYIDGIDLPTSEGKRTYKNNERIREYLLPFAEKAWEDANRADGSLPFTHDHYVKIWQLGNPVISADYILLDEAQDTAPVMLDILRQQKCPVILVGDSAQQIYEWRGAVNALAAFPNAPVCLLSQSFRFGEAIAEVANAVLETLEEGTKLRLKGLPSIPSSIGPIDDPTAILCRTNAVAVANLLSAIAKGKRPFLVGGGADVTAFVEAARNLQQGKSTAHPELACFNSWTEVQEYSKLDEGEDLKLMVKIIDEFGAETILDALRSMPTEENADLVISTAHKSKGREWDYVRLASDFPTKSKCSDADRKLLYVAVTRAKLRLDTTECPFFTGEDSLDVSAIARKFKQAEASGSLPAPKPITSAAPSGEALSIPSQAAWQSPEDFTWAKPIGKDDGPWYIRGPKGKTGTMVEVKRKSGELAKKRLGASVAENDTVALYKVG